MHPKGACITCAPSVHMYIRARAREDTAGVRMRGALSARTILTRSHVCAGVSVRLCFRDLALLRSWHPKGACMFFSCTLRVRGFHAPAGCIRMCAHYPARTFVCACVCTLSGTHMCACACECTLRVRDFFSKRTLRFAPRLVKPPFGGVRFAPKLTLFHALRAREQIPQPKSRERDNFKGSLPTLKIMRLGALSGPHFRQKRPKLSNLRPNSIK